MKNVLIISYYFPPLNKIASRRYGQMVEFMEENGWKPWVLTKDFEGDLPVPLSKKQVVRVSGSVRTIKRSTEKSDRTSFMKKSLRNFGFKPLTIDSTLKWSALVKSRFNSINEKLPQIDLVLSTYGPACAFELGGFFKNKYACPAILDFRDMAAFIEVNKNFISIMLDRVIERRYVKHYDRLITVSPTLCRILRENYREKEAAIIYNGWMYPENLKLSGSVDERYIYYAGRIYPHRVKGLEYLLRSMKASKNDLKLKIRSMSVKWVEEAFLKIVSDLNMSEQVEFLEACDSKIAQRESENAYINLIVEDMSTDNYWSKGNMTGKFMQLMPLKPPLLSIARPDNDMGPILEETGRGKLCSEIDEITEYLDDLYDSYSNYSLVEEKIAKYSKRSQAEELCSIFDELIKLNK